MSPEIATLLCLTLGGLGLAYAWWSTVRVTLFQSDLQLIRCRLDAAMRVVGKVDDPDYLRVRNQIGVLIEMAGDMTLSSMWSIAFRRKHSRPGDFDLISVLTRLPEAKPPDVAIAQSQLLFWLVSYFIFQPRLIFQAMYMLATYRTKLFVALLATPSTDGKALDRAGATSP